MNKQPEQNWFQRHGEGVMILLWIVGFIAVIMITGNIPAIAPSSEQQTGSYGQQ